MFPELLAFRFWNSKIVEIYTKLLQELIPMLVKGMSYRFKKFIQRFIAAIAAIIFISSDFLIPAASQAFVPAAAPGLLPIIGDVILFGTAAELATIAAPIIVGGFVIGAAYYYWSQEQTEQAQIKAEEKYCVANPSELLCDVPPPFTGGQSLGVGYSVTFTYQTDSGTATYSRNLWGNIEGIRGYYNPNLVQGIEILCHGGHPSHFGPSNVQTNLVWVTVDSVGNNFGMIPGGPNGGTIPVNPQIVSIARVDGQPDTGGNLPSSSSFNWKDLPQDKRQNATSLLTDDDLLPILKTGNTGILATGQSFPNGIHFFPGDGQPATFLPGPITVSDHLSQPTPSPSPEPSPEPSPSPSPIPLPSPSPEPTPPPPPLPEPEPQPDAGGAMEGRGGRGNFKGPAAKGFNWEHIMDRHAPWGRTAQQRLRQNPSYNSIFENMTENQIKASVRRAWKNRKKIKTQLDPVNGQTQIVYRGYDPQNRYTLEIWQVKETGIIKTAYPVKK